jgi:hypothetical protein
MRHGFSNEDDPIRKKHALYPINCGSMGARLKKSERIISRSFECGNSSGGCVLFTLVLFSLIPYALVDEAGAQEAIARRGTLGRRT